jgi:hypothetical protein
MLAAGSRLMSIHRRGKERRETLNNGCPHDPRISMTRCFAIYCSGGARPDAEESRILIYVVELVGARSCDRNDSKKQELRPPIERFVATKNRARVARRSGCWLGVLTAFHLWTTCTQAAQERCYTSRHRAMLELSFAR